MELVCRVIGLSPTLESASSSPLPPPPPPSPPPPFFGKHLNGSETEANNNREERVISTPRYCCQVELTRRFGFCGLASPSRAEPVDSIHLRPWPPPKSMGGMTL